MANNLNNTKICKICKRPLEGWEARAFGGSCTECAINRNHGRSTQNATRVPSGATAGMTKHAARKTAHHDKAGTFSRHLCELLFAELSKSIHDLEMTHHPSVCNIRQRGRRIFAYVYHKKQPFITVRCIGDVNSFKAEKIFEVRDYTRENVAWCDSDSFPTDLILRSEQDVLAAARMLVEYSHPLS